MYDPSLESDPVLPLGLIAPVRIARAAAAARVLFALIAGASLRAARVAAIAGVLAASAFSWLTIGVRLRRVFPIPALRTLALLTLVLLTLILLTPGVLVLLHEDTSVDKSRKGGAAARAE